VVIIKRDGTVVFRQVATSKDDRLTTAQVLAAADANLGTRGTDAEPVTPALARAQLRLEAGAGRIRNADRWETTGVASLTVQVPLTRYLVAGTGFATEAREAKFSVVGSLGARLPILGDIGALQLSAVSGLPVSGPGVYTGLQLGAWFAWTPRWAVHFDVSAGAHDTGSVDQLPAWFVTLGISRLLAR
jgi:hypothetical protein